MTLTHTKRMDLIGRRAHYYAWDDGPPQAAIVANAYEDTPDGGGAPFVRLTLTVFTHAGTVHVASGIRLDATDGQHVKLLDA